MCSNNSLKLFLKNIDGKIFSPIFGVDLSHLKSSLSAAVIIACLLN